VRSPNPFVVSPYFQALQDQKRTGRPRAELHRRAADLLVQLAIDGAALVPQHGREVAQRHHAALQDRVLHLGALARADADDAVLVARDRQRVEARDLALARLVDDALDDELLDLEPP
jgi:hypothetical protein